MRLGFLTTEPSTAPSVKVPEEFPVKLNANNGYSNKPCAAKFAKNGNPVEFVNFQKQIRKRYKALRLSFPVEKDDKRGKPSPSIPLVRSVKETFEFSTKPFDKGKYDWDTLRRVGTKFNYQRFGWRKSSSRLGRSPLQQIQTQLMK